MNTILTLTDRDFVPDAPAGDHDNYFRRGAARAVLTNSDGAVAIMHASNSGYYKLPGGGIDDGEEVLAALDREILEEVGAKIKVTGEIGIVQEYRNDDQMAQTSYVYAGTVDGELGTPELTAKEIREGFQVVWAEDIDKAMELITVTLSRDDIGLKFMGSRDLAILEEAKKLIN
jgi:ADP-ribose pyrophosphatase YjhB (NUDIX family)